MTSCLGSIFAAFTTTPPPPPFRLAVESVVIQNNRVLLTKRSPESTVAPGVWNVPAGKVEMLETTRDAVCRETLEETGMRVSVIQLLAERACIIQKRGQPAYRNIFTYETRPCDLNPQVVLNEEHTEFYWAKKEELDDEKFSSLLPRLKEILKQAL